MTVTAAHFKKRDKVPDIQSSHAILLLSGEYVLQLRDNKPTIEVPGQWSLFGGMIEAGETPRQALKREILEELSLVLQDYREYGYEDHTYLQKKVMRLWFFEADVTSIWTRHRLNEGQDVKSFQFNELCKLKIPKVMRRVIDRHYNEHKK